MTRAHGTDQETKFMYLLPTRKTSLNMCTALAQKDKINQMGPGNKITTQTSDKTDFKL